MTLQDRRFEEMLVLPVDLPWQNLVVHAYLATEKTDGMAVQVIPVAR